MENNVQRLFRVGFLPINGFGLMSFSSAVEPLRAANTLLDEHFYQIDYFAINDIAAMSSSGVSVDATAMLEDAVSMDMLFVVGGGEFSLLENEKVYELVRKLAKLGVVLGGVSGGPVTLALAGVLHNRRLTVHWEYATVLQELMPELIIEHSLFVIDRDRYTCAGGVAPVDMMNALLTQHLGAGFAQKVSDWFIHTEIRPSAGPQRSSLSERYPAASKPVILAIEAMQNHIADPLDLQQLARLSEVSPRQLNRLFSEKLEQKTMHFYRNLRLQIAEKLLRQSSMKIIEVAQATGFVSSAHFSASVQKLYAKSPLQIRRDGNAQR